MSTLPTEEAPKKKSARRLQNPIFNVAIESNDKPDRDQGLSRYTPKNRLLTSYIEKGERRVEFARRDAALEV